MMATGWVDASMASMEVRLSGVGEINDYAVAVHLGDDVPAEVGEAAVVGLIAAAADEVLGVVG